MIIRENELKLIRPFINKNIIKIITGIRRSGKSTLFTQIINELLANNIKENQIIHLKLDLFENLKYHDKDVLYNYINENLNKKQKTYLFLDEIQEVKGFEDVVNSFLNKDVDIYLTGSNSNLLSSELSTYLTGRYISFEVFPFSFKEFISYNETINLDEAFIQYVKFGGLPQVQAFDKDNEKMMLLKDLFNSILIKDLVERYNIRNVNQFTNFIVYLMSITSKQFSAINVVNFFKSENRNISRESLYNYLNYSKDAFFLYGAKRFDIQGKKVLKTNEKIFINDQGFRNLYFNNEADIEKTLENIVFFELKRRGYEIYVGNYGEYEVDFIALKGSKRKYFQVSYLLNNEKVINREFRSLLLINDQFPKYVISMDKLNMSKEGIIHKNIIDFLLEDY